MVLGWMEVECWGARAEGAGCDRSGGDMNVRYGEDAGEARQRVGVGGSGT